VRVQATAPSFFITGTDTGVGKTLIASAYVRMLALGGHRAAGMKPIAAGATWDAAAGNWHNDDVAALAAAANVTVPQESICPYLLEQPLAPHIAAELAGRRLEPEVIMAAYTALCRQSEAVVVEGVGGFLVPLAAGFDTGDLAVRFGLPVVLVVGMRLGCLSHATLTVEAIAARGLRLAGWVANRIDPDMQHVERNLDALRGLMPAACLGDVPHFARADADSARRYLELPR
jgi:dethiobiotin synthetase